MITHITERETKLSAALQAVTAERDALSTKNQQLLDYLNTLEQQIQMERHLSFRNKVSYLKKSVMHSR